MVSCEMLCSARAIYTTLEGSSIADYGGKGNSRTFGSHRPAVQQSVFDQTDAPAYIG